MKNCLQCEHSVFTVSTSGGPTEIKCQLSSKKFKIAGPADLAPAPNWCEFFHEKWCGVPGYENLYRISNMGNILKFKYEKWYPMDQSTNPKGYRSASLRENKTNKGFFSHSLVMLAFVGPRPEGFVTHHKNGIKHDNRVSNLEYITQKENCRLYHAKKSIPAF